MISGSFNKANLFNTTKVLDTDFLVSIASKDFGRIGLDIRISKPIPYIKNPYIPIHLPNIKVFFPRESVGEKISYPFESADLDKKIRNMLSEDSISNYLRLSINGDTIERYRRLFEKDFLGYGVVPGKDGGVRVYENKLRFDFAMYLLASEFATIEEVLPSNGNFPFGDPAKAVSKGSPLSGNEAEDIGCLRKMASLFSGNVSSPAIATSMDLKYVNRYIIPIIPVIYVADKDHISYASDKNLLSDISSNCGSDLSDLASAINSALTAAGMAVSETITKDNVWKLFVRRNNAECLSEKLGIIPFMSYLYNYYTEPMAVLRSRYGRYVTGLETRTSFQMIKILNATVTKEYGTNAANISANKAAFETAASKVKAFMDKIRKATINY
jgi:hypothetical protein